MWGSNYHASFYWETRYYRPYEVIGNRNRQVDMFVELEREDEELMVVIAAFLEIDL